MNSASAPSPEADYVPLLVGIDSLYVSSFSDGIGLDWERLRYEKERLRSTVGADFARFDLGGERFGLLRSGRKPYSFVLSNRAFELSLGENIRPNCHAKFLSELLWQQQLDRSLERYDTMWRTVGSRMTRHHKVSRVDAAFDFAVSSADFAREHFLSQAAKDCSWRKNRREQTLLFGKGDIVVRVYDKAAEVEEQSHKYWLYDHWGQREGVWRCEFQIRGEPLKEAGIVTTDQLRAYLPGLVRHLAKNHTSLRVPTRDSNRSRWPLHPMWRAIIETADQLTNPPDRPHPPFLTGSLYQLERQIQSVVGDLKGIAATLSRNNPDRPLTLDQTLRWVSRKAVLNHSPEIWQTDVAERVRKRGLGL